MAPSLTVSPVGVDRLPRHAAPRAGRHIQRARHSRPTRTRRPAGPAGIPPVWARWRPALVDGGRIVLRECRPAGRHGLIASPVLLLVLAALVAASWGGGRAALSRHGLVPSARAGQTHAAPKVTSAVAPARSEAT